jgi:Domain of Unknown Function with PDB structure (DUF3857)/Transglutaminase-like superfamily
VITRICRRSSAGTRVLAGLLTAMAAGLGTAPALAQAPQPGPAMAQAPFAMTYSGRIVVRADRTATEVSTKRFKILAPGAIQPLSQQRVAFIEGMQKLEIIEAYTEKADGRKVPVAPASIITRDASSGGEASFTRDQKERIIIFPDVEVGDTLVMTNRAEELRSVFPGQFFDTDIFPRSVPVASARIVIEAPIALELQVKTTGAGLTDQVEDVGAIRRHTITLAPRAYVPEEPGAVSPLDREPMLLVSTFKSYQELGLAYRAEALPKAFVTPEIRALANEITKGIDDRKAQAAAIDAWMKKNIRYVALYMASGRVVPNDAMTVLRNKLGDCKDKATLMAALLAAKGIASEQVLINLGNAYTLPEPPTMAVLNHAILYLPELDLYVDPTVTQSAFGVLAPEAYDKPVVRVSASGVTLAHTPAMRPQDHSYHIHTIINVAADGGVSGRSAESGTGVFGIVLRAAAGAVQNLGSEAAAQRQLQSFNTPGAGRYHLGNSAQAADPVVITNAFNLQEHLKLPASGPAYIPHGMPLVVRPGGFLLGHRLSGRRSAFPCYAGQQTEDVDVTFAPGLPMPMPIVSRTLNNAAFSYRSSYAIEGRTLKIHREFISHVSRQTCAPEVEAQIAEDFKLVAMNMSNMFNFGAVASVAPPKQPQPIAPPRPASAEPPKQPHMQEATRVVPSDQKRRIDFISWLEPDCSTPELPVLRILEQPKNGKLVVERGTGFTSFPQSNPRYECNRRKSDGITVVYEPNARFAGVDSITIEAIFPSGSAVKRHYAIEVKAVESVSSATPTIAPTPVATTPRTAVESIPATVGTRCIANSECGSGVCHPVTKLCMVSAAAAQAASSTR